MNEDIDHGVHNLYIIFNRETYKENRFGDNYVVKLCI